MIHGQTDNMHIARKRMVEEQLVKRGIKDQNVLKAMLHIPRHYFVEEALSAQAYHDNPLSIGQGQTISQPYSVAKMTEALRLNGEEKILEIGTGCGYQTSILASIVKQVYTIERIKPLAMQARRNLKKLGFRNIVLRVGDGTRGWPEQGEFDGILIAAGSPKIPEPLINQLKIGRSLVIPVGDHDSQNLYRITRTNSKPKIENLGPCRFVKLVGMYGWEKQTRIGQRTSTVKKRHLV